MDISEMMSPKNGLSEIPLYDNAAWTTTLINAQKPRIQVQRTTYCAESLPKQRIRYFLIRDHGLEGKVYV